jgi:hypothetical protein
MAWAQVLGVSIESDRVGDVGDNMGRGKGDDAAL